MYSLLTVLRVVYAILFGLSSKLPAFIFIELFFCKKIPLSRHVEYVMDGSMDHSVSERCMYVTPIRSDLL